ncbi:hypothetical protein O181_104027 [Austropuccinia psidii MF-1]|uniref:Uncharacterized protein n=1 Tax=Austropuccinia psidii MF-1 TaxID=1389203 RepID=A0A9Q3JKV4_9BASI|nr:hypothetical protein [Austropuccinia psidii MF-1]
MIICLNTPVGVYQSVAVAPSFGSTCPVRGHQFFLRDYDPSSRHFHNYIYRSRPMAIAGFLLPIRMHETSQIWANDSSGKK